MAQQNLYEIAQVVYNQMNPNPSDESAVHREEVFSAAKTIYARAVWIFAKEEAAQEGYFNVPSYLLSEAELEVVNNRINTENLAVLDGLPDDMWLQNVGGISCKCRYVKSNLNLQQLLCDDDCLGDSRSYFVLGKEIVFPKGTHANKLPIIYANMGHGVDGQMPIAESLGSIVQRELQKLYLGNVAQEDKTNDSSSSIK